MSRRRQTSTSFKRARLDALGGVEHHDGGVDGGQRAVGIFREVLVAGGVEQVEHPVAILERHHRGADGDAALALDAHPVGAGLAAVALGADLTGELDGAAEQQELFGQGRLAGVGVRDDREGAAAGDGVGGVPVWRWPEDMALPICQDGDQLEHFPVGWKHPTDKEMLQTNDESQSFSFGSSRSERDRLEAALADKVKGNCVDEHLYGTNPCCK